MSQLDALLARVGRYVGPGLDHRGRPFLGELTLSPMLDGRAVSIRFSATGDDGAVQHDEHAWIATTPEGRLALWSLHTNAPGVTRHELVSSSPASGADESLVFRLGDPDDREATRVRVSIDLLHGGDLIYRYGWAEPGDDFADRSRVRLRRVGEEEPST